jgi:hypothetical protein
MARVVYQVTLRVDKKSPVAKLAKQKGRISLGEIVLFGDMLLSGGATVSESERESFYPQEGEGIPLVVKMRISDGASSFVSSSLVKDGLGGVRRIMRITDCLIVAARHFFGDVSVGQAVGNNGDMKSHNFTGERATKRRGSNREVIDSAF